MEWWNDGLEIAKSWERVRQSRMQIQCFLSLKWKARLFILLFLFDNYNKEARKPRMVRKTGLNKQGWNR